MIRHWLHFHLLLAAPQAGLLLLHLLLLLRLPLNVLLQHDQQLVALLDDAVVGAEVLVENAKLITHLLVVLRGVALE